MVLLFKKLEDHPGCGHIPPLFFQTERQNGKRTRHRTLVRSLRAQLVVADSTARLWQTRYAAAERVVATQDQVIQDYEARLRVERQRNDTSWSGPFVRALKYVGVFAAGYLIASR